MPTIERTPKQIKFTDADLEKIERIKEIVRPNLIGREPTLADAVRFGLDAALILAAKNSKKSAR